MLHIIHFSKKNKLCILNMVIRYVYYTPSIHSDLRYNQYIPDTPYGGCVCFGIFFSGIYAGVDT